MRERLPPTRRKASKNYSSQSKSQARKTFKMIIPNIKTEEEFYEYCNKRQCAQCCLGAERCSDFSSVSARIQRIVVLKRKAKLEKLLWNNA